MRSEKRANGTRVLRGSNGREYIIKYFLGIPKPWVLLDDNESRHATLEAAEGRAHEIEALKLGEDENQKSVQ